MNKKKIKEKREKIEKDFQKSMSDLEKQINELKESGIVDPNKIKVVRVNLPNIDPKKKFLLGVVETIVSILLFFGLSGYIKWVNYSSLYYFLLLEMIFIVGEIILKKAIDLLMPKFAVYSLGAFTIIASIISFVIALLVAPNVSINSTFSLIMFFVIFLITRAFIKTLIINRLFMRTRKNKPVL